MSSLYNIKKLSIVYSAITVIYLAILMERKYSIFFEKGAFLLSIKMSVFEKIFFVFFMYCQVFIVFVIVLVCIDFFNRLFFNKNSNKNIESFIVFCFLIVYATIDYKVFSYFRDFLDIEILKSLGGGSIINSIYYVISEIYDTGPYAIIVLMLFVFIGILIRKIKISLFYMPFVDWLAKKVNVFFVFLFLIVFVLVGAFFELPLYSHLNKNFVSKFLTSSINFITDFDLDGYSLTTIPRDTSLFDKNRNPYAIDIPNNGVDENSVAGDLPYIKNLPEYDFIKKNVDKNVVLIICESMRGDLLERKVLGSPVMNKTSEMDGQVFQVFSHTAFTTPSITSILSGSLSLLEKNKSIFKVVSDNLSNVELGVFSGQSEAFGGLEDKNDLRLADKFFDSRDGERRERMFVGTNDASLKMPGDVVFASFNQWLENIPHEQPFFSYVNLQELHFPYNSDKIKNLIVSKKIDRNEISVKNKEKLIMTYYNAARQLDEHISKFIKASIQKKSKYETIVVLLGDHGEELFDHGVLGHGTSISFEQNSTFLKIFGLDGDLKIGYIYQSQLQKLLYSLIIGDLGGFYEYYDQSLWNNFMFVGDVRKPKEVGKIIDGKLIKYNFNNKTYYFQEKYGSRFQEWNSAVDDLIWPWEAYIYIQSLNN